MKVSKQVKATKFWYWRYWLFILINNTSLIKPTTTFTLTKAKHNIDRKTSLYKTFSTPVQHPLKLLILIMFAQSPHNQPWAPLQFFRSLCEHKGHLQQHNSPPSRGEPARDASPGHLKATVEGKVCLFYWCFRWRNASKNTRPRDPRTSSPCNSRMRHIRCRRDRH